MQTEGKHTVACASNEGKTINPYEINRFCERFYRAEKARTNPGSDGAGLGLAITGAIMTAHGGQIRVTSSGCKTSFSLVFLYRQLEC